MIKLMKATYNYINEYNPWINKHERHNVLFSGGVSVFSAIIVVSLNTTNWGDSTIYYSGSNVQEFLLHCISIYCSDFYYNTLNIINNNNNFDYDLYKSVKDIYVNDKYNFINYKINNDQSTFYSNNYPYMFNISYYNYNIGTSINYYIKNTLQLNNFNFNILIGIIVILVICLLCCLLNLLCNFYWWCIDNIFVKSMSKGNDTYNSSRRYSEVYVDDKHNITGYWSSDTKTNVIGTAGEGDDDGEDERDKPWNRDPYHTESNYMEAVITQLLNIINIINSHREAFTDNLRFLYDISLYQPNVNIEPSYVSSWVLPIMVQFSRLLGSEFSDLVGPLEILLRRIYDNARIRNAWDIIGNSELPRMTHQEAQALHEEILSDMEESLRLIDLIISRIRKS